MSKITPVTAVAFAALLALIALFAFTAPRAEAASDLRVSLACSPLTSSQAAQPGDPQACRLRIRNFGSSPISDITFHHDTPNIGVSIAASKFGVAIPCDQNTFTCDAFTLTTGQTVMVTYQYTFDSTQDQRGLTTATAWGTQAGYPISTTATEQKSLP